jgi:queuine tRNA-ribosyltransferase subunit QTRTD1
VKGSSNILKMASRKQTKLGFEILSNSDPTSGARLGRLAVEGRKALETPGFIAVTSRGVVPHMTPDVIAAHAQFGGVHMALEDCRSHVILLLFSPDIL